MSACLLIEMNKGPIEIIDRWQKAEHGPIKPGLPG